MAGSHEFGGDWTTEKLERVRKYLTAYTTIFTRNQWAKRYQTTYVDAFAGAGYRVTSAQSELDYPLFETPEPEMSQLLKGSARIALEVDPPFDNYLFIDSKQEWIESLHQLKEEFPVKADKVRIVQSEANEYLQNWCAGTNWRRNRAVVFLDPYGMQVEWALIETIARTKAIDLWILLPLGAAINRLLTKRSLPPAEWSEKLTRFFGTDDWMDAFYPKKTRLTLFGEEEVQVKDADFDSISRYFVQRLKTVFAGVADNPLPLRNSKNNPIYLLCFAGNAPVAKKIAQDILRR